MIICPRLKKARLRIICLFLLCFLVTPTGMEVALSRDRCGVADDHSFVLWKAKLDDPRYQRSLAHQESEVIVPGRNPYLLVTEARELRQQFSREELLLERSITGGRLGPHHRQAVFGRGDRLTTLKAGLPGRYKEDLVKAKVTHCFIGDIQMPAVDGVECPAKYAYLHRVTIPIPVRRSGPCCPV